MKIDMHKYLATLKVGKISYPLEVQDIVLEDYGSKMHFFFKFPKEEVNFLVDRLVQERDMWKKEYNKLARMFKDGGIE